MANENPKEIVIAAKERGPGPGRYGLPSTCGYSDHDSTKRVQPAYTFGQRVKNLYANDCSPGPGYHIESSITRHGKDGTPSYSILGRPKNLRYDKTPAPGAYSPEKVHPQGETHAPAYSMSARTRYRKRDANPSPNIYRLPPLVGPYQPNRRSAPSYSMTDRPIVGGFAEDLAKTPGPGRYNSIEPNTMKSRAPVYSMLGRSFMPGDNTKKPGPGAYRPECVHINRAAPPKFSLGIRHSEYVTPLIIEVSE
ncbi:ciliary microtubule associated protein 1A-like [Tubulanus polymorphus]|uniref:ciliary microtubule associated protein 1A-like n=1 Tax=Tubulanus polymorphus TaxID=672921 RepID=UPI003DA428CB